MKYQAIYKIIRESDCNSIYDGSHWQKKNKNLAETALPLWLILENRRVNLRIWVTQEFGELRITTAQLDLDCKSKAYHDSHRRYPCRTQTELANRLKNILSGDSQQPEVAGQ